MMKRIFFSLVFLFTTVFVYAQQKLTVNVHPGVELFTIVQILGESFPNPNSSDYSKEVMDYFGKYKDHAAVKKVAGFKKVFTDLTELGWCMSDFPNIKIYEPENSVWYDYNGKENVLEYIRLCRDFFNDTKFWDFYQAHEKQYEAWGNALKVNLERDSSINQLEKFYGFKAEVKWYICIDPLNSWGSHAIDTKLLNPQFGDILVYNTGYFNKKGDVNTTPVFEYKGFENLVWHEGSHVFLNASFKKYKQEIEALSYLFNKDDDGMKRNNISNWEYCLNENVVRAIVAGMNKKYHSDLSFKKEIARQTLSDFIYVEDLAGFIYNNYTTTKKYKDFGVFFPEVLRFMKKTYPVVK